MGHGIFHRDQVYDLIIYDRDLGSCAFSYRSDKHGNLFWQVEKLIPHHPDSALVLLEKVRDINGLSLREKARYCLLWTESRDEAGLRHTSDSIISIATDYYRTTRGCYWPPKAWFYRGRSMRIWINRP